MRRAKLVVASNTSSFHSEIEQIFPSFQESPCPSPALRDMPPSAPPTCRNLCTGVQSTVQCTHIPASISRSLTVYYLTGYRAQTVVSSIERGESGTAPTQTLPTGTQTFSDRQLCEVALSVSQRGTSHQDLVITYHSKSLCQDDGSSRQ